MKLSLEQRIEVLEKAFDRLEKRINLSITNLPGDVPVATLRAEIAKELFEVVKK